MSEDKPDVHFGPCTHFILSRRKFLGGTATALASIPLASACEFANVDDSLLQPVNPTIAFNTSMETVAAIADVGGVGYVEDGALRVLLIRNAEDSLLAFNSKCPHQDLEMAPAPGAAAATWDQNAQTLRCAYHQALYGADGGVIEQPNIPPDVTGLERYDVEFDAMTGEGTVFVLGDAPEDNTSEG